MTLSHEQQREREVLVCQLLANGKTRKEVAHEIDMHKITVHKIVAALKARHGVSTDAGLVVKLMKEGWIR